MDDSAYLRSFRRFLILMKIDNFWKSCLTPLSSGDTDLKLVVYSKLGFRLTVYEKKNFARLKVWAQECAEIFDFFSFFQFGPTLNLSSAYWSKNFSIIQYPVL